MIFESSENQSPMESPAVHKTVDKQPTPVSEGDEKQSHWKRNTAIGVALTGILGTVGIVADNKFYDGRVMAFAADKLSPVTDRLPLDRVPFIGDDAPAAAEGAGQETEAVQSDPLVTEAVSSPAPDTAALGCVASMALPDRIGQMWMVGVQGNDILNTTGFFAEHHIGSAIIMNAPDNLSDGSIATLADSAPLGIMIATDEEGGQVQRFDSLGVLPSAAEVAATMTPEGTTAMMSEHGTKLKAAGIDLVLGPVVDVPDTIGAAPLYDRAFSSDPAVVTNYAQATIAGWQAAGLNATVKHWPGLGGATGNTDHQTATTDPLAELQARDMLPFQNLASTGAAVMIGSQIVPDLTNGKPATQSPEAYALLRQTYGDNLILTDSLDALAIDNPREAMANAIIAGADIAMMAGPPLDPATDEFITIGEVIRSAEDQLNAALAAGTFTEAALNEKVVRVLAAKDVDPCAVG